MAKFEGEIEITMTGDEIEEFIEAVREVGVVRLSVRIEGRHRRPLMNALARATSHMGSTYTSFDADWWNDRMRPILGNRAKEEL